MKLNAAWLCAIGILFQSTAFSAMLVYDPENYIQNVNTAMYTYQMTQQFSQQINYLKGGQYTTLLGQLTQLTNTYQLHATNLTGYAQLQNLLSNNNKVINSYNGSSDYSMLQTLNPESPTYAQDRDAILKEYYHNPENPMQVSQDLGNVVASNSVNQLTDEATQHQQEWERVLDAQKVIAKQNETTVTRQAQLDQFSDAIKNLGSTSQLQTEQLSAAELHLLLQQQEEQTKSLEKIQQTQVETLAQKTSAEAEDFEDEQQRLKAAADQGTSGYGKDKWGDF